MFQFRCRYINLTKTKCTTLQSTGTKIVVYFAVYRATTSACVKTKDSKISILCDTENSQLFHCLTLIQTIYQTHYSTCQSVRTSDNSLPQNITCIEHQMKNRE